MIVFCEDCGQKNHLTTGLSLDGKAVFICRGCGYKNAYATSAPVEPMPDIVISTLEKLQTQTPWMIGFFIFHPINKIIFNQMPETLAPADLEFLGTLIYQGYNDGCRCFKDIESFSVKIADKILFAVLNDHSNMLVLATLDRALSASHQKEISTLFAEHLYNKGTRRP